jgi:purine nucleosidase
MRKAILLLLAMLYISYDTSGQTSIIIDADTANEVDDIVAIARALMADDIEVTGLTAAQWSHQGIHGRHTARESWDLNNEILRIMGRQDIPSRQGSELKVGEQWSGYALFSGGKLQPRKSNAADLIIEKALGHHSEDKLIILCAWAADQHCFCDTAGTGYNRQDICPLYRHHIRLVKGCLEQE